MANVTATEAARRFADLLDEVEHSGRRYIITRHGRAVAQIEPVGRGRGADVKAMLRGHRPDTEWAGSLADVRGLVEIDQRP